MKGVYKVRLTKEERKNIEGRRGGDCDVLWAYLLMVVGVGIFSLILIGVSDLLGIK